MNIDFKLIFKNNEYLLMVNSEKMGISNELLSMYHKSLILNGMISLFLFGSSDKMNLTLQKKIMLLLTGLFSFIFNLGANSRASGLILASLFLSVMLFRKHTLAKYIILTILIFGVLLSYTVVIYGRGVDLQGIGQILLNINDMKYSNVFDDNFIIGNVFAGAWTFYEADRFNDFYPEMYKILSFSPFPSSIDHFTDYIKYEKRLHEYIPYGANSEIYKFGLMYIGLYFFLLYVILRQMNKSLIHNKLVGYLLCAPGYFYFIANQQYPLRNYFRFFLLSGLLCFVYNNYQKLRKHEGAIFRRN
ncbi:hypothetical protein [Spirosoma oryzae]|uniref:hypothetical protein n=1 Tax=Spirosoma oryzae TaxID=1469603 RepID=UPI0011B23786|nr:hypothetical protein [Spirosoma oryzae]